MSGRAAMLNRAYCLSSSKDLFAIECEHLKQMFIKLKYPLNLINSTIATFVDSVAQPHGEISEADRETQKPVRITLPFKDQKSADAVHKQLKDLGKKLELRFNRFTQVLRSATS